MHACSWLVYGNPTGFARLQCHAPCCWIPVTEAVSSNTRFTPVDAERSAQDAVHKCYAVLSMTQSGEKVPINGEAVQAKIHIHAA